VIAVVKKPGHRLVKRSIRLQTDNATLDHALETDADLEMLAHLLFSSTAMHPGPPGESRQIGARLIESVDHASEETTGPPDYGVN